MKFTITLTCDESDQTLQMEIPIAEHLAEGLDDPTVYRMCAEMDVLLELRDGFRNHLHTLEFLKLLGSLRPLPHEKRPEIL